MLLGTQTCTPSELIESGCENPYAAPEMTLTTAPVAALIWVTEFPPWLATQMLGPCSEIPMGSLKP